MSRSRDVSAVQNNLGVAIPPAAAGKNAIINGGMDVWQRGTSFALTSSGVYCADRWQGYRSVAGSTVSRQTTSDTTNLPNIQYCSRVQRDNGNTSAASIIYAQSVETANSIPFAGKTVTLSFYARAGANYSASSNLLNYKILTGTGTDENGLMTVYTGSTTLSNTNVTLTTTWQRFTATVTFASNVSEFALWFNYTPLGTAGAADYFEITGVQLELGSSATPFSRAGGTIQGELAACQRYYWRLTSQYGYTRFGQGAAFSSTGAYTQIQCPVQMRTAPTSIDYSNILLDSYGGGTITVTSLTNGVGSNLIQGLTATVTSGLTQYRPYFLIDNGSGGYVGFSAEL